MHVKSWRCPLLLILILGSIVLLLAAGCRPSLHANLSGQEAGKQTASGTFATGASEQAEDRRAVPMDTKAYVGNAACAYCHQAVFQRHQTSRHAHTLHTVNLRDSGMSVPPLGRAGTSGYSLVAQHDTLYFTQDGQVGHGQPLQLALGSGKTGVTYVRVLNPNQMIEMRVSYFPRRKQWYLTPGQNASDHYIGDMRAGPFVRQCILCHAVAVDAGSGMPERRFYGVGCEACHGPARAHVTAMQSGRSADLHIEKLGQWSAVRLNGMCGQCHGNSVSANVGNAVGQSQTNRFMSFGLRQSRCYLASTRTLSCLTCHNAHENARTDRQFYEAKCLTCHAGNRGGDKEIGTQGVAKSHSPIVNSNSCPVNPRAGCIGCHMPARDAFPGLNLPTQMVDHYIRVYPTKKNH